MGERYVQGTQEDAHCWMQWLTGRTYGSGGVKTRLLQAGASIGEQRRLISFAPGQMAEGSSWRTDVPTT